MRDYLSPSHDPKTNTSVAWGACHWRSHRYPRIALPAASLAFAAIILAFVSHRRFAENSQSASGLDLARLSLQCAEGLPGAEVGAPAQSRSSTNGLDNPFVFIALINDDDALKVSRLAVAILRKHGIESSIEGGIAGLSISVRNLNVEKAVKAIAAAPQLKGRGIVVRDKFLYLINGAPPKKPVPEPYVVIAHIKDAATEQFVKGIHIELLKRGIASTIESEGAGLRISVSQREVEKAVKAIAAPPDLREKGIRIKEEYLYFLQ